MSPRLITIKPVALCIIEHTWSLETLRSLDSIVSTEGNHRACEKEEILKKITDKIEVIELAELEALRHDDLMDFKWRQEEREKERYGTD